MATLVQQQLNDKEKDTQEDMSNISGAPSAAITPGVSSTPGSQAKTPSSGRFVNLQRYLQAGAGGAEKAKGRIEQQFGKETGKLQEQTTQTAGAAGSQLEAERQRIAQAGGFAQQIAQDPTKLVQDPSQLQAFTQLRTGQTGLSGIGTQAQTGFGTAQQQLGKVQQLAGLTGSEAGRFELLKQSMGKPGYSRGQQRLDQLLLQSSGRDVLGALQKDAQTKALTGQQTLTAEQAKIQEQLGMLGTQATEASKLLTGALGSVATSPDDPNTAIDESKGSGALGALQESLRGRQQQFIQQQLAEQQELQRALSSLKFNPEGSKTPGMVQKAVPSASDVDIDLLNRYGLNLQEGQRLFDVDLSGLTASFQPDTLTEQQFAKDTDLANYQALMQLSGQSNMPYLTQVGKGAKGVELNAAAIKDVQQRLANRQQEFTDLTKSSTGGALSEVAWLNQMQPNIDKHYQKFLNESGVGAATKSVFDAMAPKKGESEQERAIRLSNVIESNRSMLEGAVSLDVWENPYFIDRSGAFGEKLANLLNWSKQIAAFNPNKQISRKQK